MSKTIHATQNEDGTYRVVVTATELETVIEKADICITAYAIKDDKKLMSFTVKE